MLVDCMYYVNKFFDKVTTTAYSEMAKKTPSDRTVHRPADPNVMGLRGAVVDQPITATLDENYMPYAMSVIVSRAIPEIDSFKPAHRKLLYTMYKMGLLTGSRTKSANIVGQTMRLNPHGDQAIYETMVRLAKEIGRASCRERV